MAQPVNVSDTFLLVVSVGRVPAEIDVDPEYDSQQVQRGAAYGVAFRYKIGKPPMTQAFSVTWINDPSGSITSGATAATGSGAPSATVSPAAPEHEYDHDNSATTDPIPVGPHQWRPGTVKGRVPASAPEGSVYQGTIGSYQP